ncbi:MAG TPA: hypothetical protein PK347_01635 [Burkholderiaceae bacterium]|nr:hypothetical protein [Burkholderiaceae bacterium]
MLFIPEYAASARIALELARREAVHLRFTQSGLFAQVPTLEWVQSLPDKPTEGERLDAFVSRFSRLQDHLGDKLLPRFAELVGASPRSLLDALNTAERMQWVDSAQRFVSARKLRNLMVHEYMTDQTLFLDAVLAANDACHMFYDSVERIQVWAITNGLLQESI